MSKQDIIEKKKYSFLGRTLGKYILIQAFLLYFSYGLYAQQSSLVHLESGELVYTPFAVQDQTNQVHVIPDFSHAGYKGGGVAIPAVAVVRTLEPQEGDDTKLIQDAIDEVALLPQNTNGHRGAILLKAGNYSISAPLVINASGVVLRGEGQGRNGTVIYSNLRTKHSIVTIEGGGIDVNDNTQQLISTPYVPIGAKAFSIVNASSFSVGDSIVVTRTPNDTWINELGMDEVTLCAGDNGCNGWTPGSYTVNHERVITDIASNTITINIPVVDVMEEHYGGGRIAKVIGSDRISQCGVESIRFDSFYSGNNDEDHAWDAVRIVQAENCWVKEITGVHLAYSTVDIDNANFNTIEDCAYIQPISQLRGGRRYSYDIRDGLGNLFQRCYAKDGRHDFATGSRVTGPNVFLDGLAEQTNADIGPHHRWATGTLFDNIEGGQIRVRNRGNSGSGHGWAGAQTMFWNSVSRLDMKVDSPKGSINWGIGCKGVIQDGEGFWESWNTPVLPRSLYLQQLEDRLGDEAIINTTNQAQRDGSIISSLRSWRGYGMLINGGAVGAIPVVSFASVSSTLDLSTWEENTIEVTASDTDGRVISVRLLLNGEPLAIDETEPFIFENIRSEFNALSLGKHALEAIATDNNGNTVATQIYLSIPEPKPIDLNDYQAIDLCKASATHHNEDSSAGKTIDGNQDPESRWSAEENGAVLVVEACEAQFTDIVGIKWYRGDERQAIFDLEVSLDSTNWTNVYSGNSSGVSSIQESFSIGGDSIKYMRYTGYGNSDSRWNSIIEVGFYKNKPEVIDITPIILSVDKATTQNKMVIYPNPATNNIKVTSQINGNSQLVVFDLKGRNHLEIESNTGNFEFLTDNFSPGIYLLRVSNGEETQNGKLVVID